MSLQMIVSALFPIYWQYIERQVWKPLEHSIGQFQDVQSKRLLSILKQNQDTEYGQKYGFGGIRSYAEFREQVPVNTYEDLQPYIEKQARTGNASLTSEAPIFYAQTSGTTSKPKNIPVLRATVREHRQLQKLMAHMLFSHVDGLIEGKYVALAGGSVEGHLPSGQPYGAMSGMLYRTTPRFVRYKYVIPPEVLEISDYETKYFTMVAYMLAEENISVIAVPNPSSLMKLLEILNTQQDDILRAIYELPQGLSSGRIEQVRQILNSAKKVTYAEFWPNLRVVSTWMGGSCAMLIPKLRQSLPNKSIITELGHLASECRGTLTINPLTNQQIPVFWNTLYEFVERETWEENTAHVIPLEDLGVGKQYYLFITSSNGLYRYAMNDIFEVTGDYLGLPTLRFLQKGQGITNITGEKLSEWQVIQAVREGAPQSTFFMALANEQQHLYQFYVEAAETLSEEEIEEHLRQLNVEYDAKRASGRLHALHVIPLTKGTAEAYKQHCLLKGQRESQYKTIHLQNASDSDFDFDAWRISS